MVSFKRVVVLTGAGISAESGLATFRGLGGLWEGVPISEVATLNALRANPDCVNAFYNQRWDGVLNAQPNPAHEALAQLEQAMPDMLVVTQNIDDLHERAGQKNLLHMHGEILKIRCDECLAVGPRTGPINSQSECSACKLKGALRPHMVLFGEIPFHQEEIERALYQCDLFVAIGTSGQVYPAAGFIQLVRAINRAHSIEINLDPGEGKSRFAETRLGLASQLVPQLVKELLA